MADAADIAWETTQYGDPQPEPPPARKPDMRNAADRAAAGLPPIQRRTGARNPGAPPRKPGRPTGKPQPKSYVAGIEGLGQLAAGALLFVSPPDAAAVGFHTPPIAQALNDLAQQDPRVAAILDKLLQVGPYGALLASVMPLVLQILCNHGKVPVGLLGTMDPDQLVTAFVGSMPG